MAGTITAKAVRIYSLEVPILPDSALGTLRVAYRCDTPDGVIEIPYDVDFNQADDLGSLFTDTEATFKADVVTRGYSFT